MLSEFGTLKFLPALQHPALLAETVYKALSTPPQVEIGVAEIDPGLSDTAAFCEQYQIKPSQAANCVVLEAKRANCNWFAACVILGSTRADVNGVARKTLDARRVSFAPIEQAIANTSMEYGAITPVGLSADWHILIDKAVAETDFVIIGSGVRRSKLCVAGSFLSSLPNADVIEGLAQPRI